MPSIKEKFHNLIDVLPENENLEAYYSLILNFQHHQEGQITEGLSQEQKKELDLSYIESFDKKQLIPHEEITKLSSKWFLK